MRVMKMEMLLLVVVDDYLRGTQMPWFGMELDTSQPVPEDEFGPIRRRRQLQ